MTAVIAAVFLVALGAIAVARAWREDRRFKLAPWPPKLLRPEPAPPTVYFVEEVWDAGGIARRYPGCIVFSEVRRGRGERCIVTMCARDGRTMVRTVPSVADAYDAAVAQLEEWARR